MKRPRTPIASRLGGMAVLAGVLAAAQSQALSAPAVIESLPLGAVVESDLPNPIGTDWLALGVKHRRTELVPVVPRITRVINPEFDPPGTDLKKASGRLVQIDGLELEPLVVLRASFLRAGVVPTATVLGKWPRQELKLHGEKYVFESRCSARGNPRQCVVSLAHGKQRQCLAYAFPTGDEFAVAVSLVWAGDVDRDGRLDLLVSVGTGRGSEGTAVFLSSVAEPNRLVRGVAGYIKGDCDQ
jgi:hypothetical protein